MRLILVPIFCLYMLLAGCDRAQPPGEGDIETPDLISMIKAAEFDSVTRIIEDYQRRFEADPANELYAAVPYRQFIDAATDPDLEQRMEEWEHHSTESFAPYLAMCSYSYGEAMKIRGNASASRKSKALSELRTHCDWALSINPRLPYAYGRLIKAGQMDNNRQEIERWLRKGLSVLPTSYFVRAAYQIGLDPSHGGSNEEMLAFAKQGQEYADQNPMLKRLLSNAYNTIGNQHSRKDEYEKAIIAYKQSIDYYIWVNPLISLSAMYSSTGEHKLAIDVLTRAIKLNNSPWTYKSRARIYADAGRFEEAMADIDFALEKQPDNQRFIKEQANIFFKMEEYSNALGAYERLVKLDAADAWVWKQIAYIKQRKIIDISAAEESFKHALALDPGDNWTWHSYATLLYNKKDKRAPVAFQAYVDICGSGENCNPVDLARSRKFLDCVNGNPDCELETTEYADWSPGA